MITGPKGVDDYARYLAKNSIGFPYPVISGTGTVGSVLTVSNGPFASPTYQWRRDGVNIIGATTQTYTVLSADAGHVIDAVVSGIKSSNSITIAQQFPFPGATVSLDFANAQYSTPLVSALNFTRGGTKTDLLPSSAAGFVYNTYTNNVPVIIPGKGILIEGAVTNLLLNSTAPVTQVVNLAIGVYCLWMTGTGSSVVSASTATILTTNTISTLRMGTTATQNNSILFTVVVAGNVTVTVNGQVNTFQLEANNFGGTSFIPTTGTTATRAFDDAPFIGTAQSTLANTAIGSCICAAQSLEGTGTQVTVMRIGHQTFTTTYPQYKDSGISNQSNGGGGLVVNYGSGIQADAHYSVSWSTSERSLLNNGGIASAGNGLYTSANANQFLGSFGGGVLCFAGFISRVDIFNTELTQPQLRGFTAITPFQYVMSGDSLTQRSDGIGSSLINFPGSQISVPTALSTLLNQAVLNNGLEGANSTGIKNRYLSGTEFFGLPQIIWSGRNNFAALSTVTADIASMVAANTSGRNMVLSVINSSSPNEQSGGSVYTQIIALNNALAAAYGSSYLDIRALLVAAYDPSNLVDVLDHTNDEPPYSLRDVTATGYLDTAIDAAATTFNTIIGAQSTNTSSYGANFVLKIDSEYIQVTTAAANQPLVTVNSCVRGYAGSTAAAHAQGAYITATDPLHLGQPGRQFVASAIQTKMKALGWI